jgi:hypothetical protein
MYYDRKGDCSMRTFLSFFFVLTIAASALAVPPAAPTEQLLESYFSIQKNLASDSTAGVLASAAKIAAVSRQAAENQPRAKAPLIALSEAAAKLKTADLKSLRNEFGELSNKLIAYLQAVGVKGNPPYQYYCPMAKKGWLQPEKGVRNPYYGSSMPTCGELVAFGKPF